MTSELPSAMTQQDLVDQALRRSAVRCLIEATPADFLAFLTPRRIAEISRTLNAPVSASTVRRALVDNEGRYDPQVLLLALSAEVDDALFDPGAVTSVPTVVEALVGIFGHAVLSRAEERHRGLESFLLLLLAAADTDPERLLGRIDATLRSRLQVEYGAAPIVADLGDWCRELADVRYGELVFARLTRNLPVAEGDDETIRWLVAQYAPADVPRRLTQPNPRATTEHTRANATTRAVVDAALVGLARAHLADLLSFLTPSMIADGCDLPVDRTTASRRWARPGSGAFDPKLLVADLWRPGAGLNGQRPTPESMAPGANDDPEGDAWVRLAYVEAALSDVASNYGPPPLDTSALVNALAGEGRRFLEPAAQTARTALRAMSMLHEGKVARARIEPTDPERLEHAFQRVLTVLTTTDTPDRGSAAERTDAQLDPEAAGWYGERIGTLNDLRDALAELHRDIRDARPDVTSYLIWLGKPQDRLRLLTFEMLEWVYRWKAHASGDLYSFAILPSRWLHRTTLDGTGQRWLWAPDGVDDECLKVAYANSDGTAGNFLAHLELTGRGERLINCWTRWTTSCACTSESLNSSCPILDIEQRIDQYLQLARGRRLHRFRGVISRLDERALADDLLIVPAVIRDLLETSA